MFHSDLTVRYERRIQKGTIRVKKRENTNKWAYLRWHLSAVWHEFKYFWPILIMSVFLVIWTHAFQFILDNYANSCTLNSFDLTISVDISYWLGKILPLFFYLTVTSIAIVVIARYKLKLVDEWQLDLKRSNKLYIVEKRRSKIFIKLQLIFIGVIIISCFYLAWFFGEAGYRTLSKYNYNISDMNRALIAKCYQDKSSS